MGNLQHVASQGEVTSKCELLSGLDKSDTSRANSATVLQHQQCSTDCGSKAATFAMPLWQPLRLAPKPYVDREKFLPGLQDPVEYTLTATGRDVQQ